jgi:nucleoid-associated protein YgaU
MTRETKIGLLVGLGFIVVFAMLLSHSAPAPSPGDALQLAKARSEAASKLQRPIDRAPVEPVGAPSAGGAIAVDASPSPVAADKPEPGSDLSPLPNPAALDPPVTRVVVNNESARTEASPTGSSESDVLEMTRMAPALPEPVVEPEVTARPETPSVSPQPAPQPAEPARAVPSPVPPPAKEYVVQKGQTLGQIAKAVYGTSSPKVMDFLVSANKAHVKNRNSVVEGQKLNVPQLPPDMFEPVGTSLNVGKPDAAQASKINDLINNRQAPGAKSPEPSAMTRIDPPLSAEKLETPAAPPAKTDLALKSEKSEPKSGPKAPKTDLSLKSEKLETAMAKASDDKASKDSRVYEVQTKETFSSIAREQLGSTTLWKEIAKLNKGVDPAKIKPGTKLKLPARRPLADSVASGKST